MKATVSSSDISVQFTMSVAEVHQLFDLCKKAMRSSVKGDRNYKNAENVSIKLHQVLEVVQKDLQIVSAPPLDSTE